MIDYAKILTKNYVDKQWSISGDSYDGLSWLDSSPKPTKEELNSQWEDIQAEEAANAYKAKRASEYPLIADQLDMLWHMMDDETISGKNSTWYNTIKEVKDNNPK